LDSTTLENIRQDKMKNAITKTAFLLSFLILICVYVNAESLSSVLLENFKTTIVARQDGKLSLKVSEGSHVALNEKLFSIGVDEIKLHLKMSEIQYQKSLARLERASKVKTEQELALAQFVFQKKEELFQAGGISEDGYDLARMEYELDIQQPREFEITIASLEVEEKKTAWELMKLEFQKSEYFSPAVGQITKIYSIDGQWIRAGDKILDQISINPLFIALNVPLKNHLALSPGTKISTIIDTGNGFSDSTGTIVYSIDELDGVDQLVRILIRIDNEKYEYKPGMRVNIQMP
jgi:multidrug efflux pump subunit AcrA (membrane-fusion protein)